MALATDPLSLVFIGCFLFGAFFLLMSTLLGAWGHGGVHHTGGGPHLHVGSHVSHLHSPGQAHGGPVAVHHGTAAPASQTGSGHAVHAQNQSLQPGVPGLLPHLLSSLRMLVFFLLGFGFFGYVFHNATRLDVLFTLLLATVAGLVLTGLVLALLFRIFGDSESETIQDVSDRTGLIARVSLPIQPDGVGEVIYVSPGGLRKSIPARSIDGRGIERGQEVIILHYQRGIAEVETWERYFETEPGEGKSRMPTEAELEQLRTLLQDHNDNDTELVMRKDLQ